jgi:hypothetical protein
MFLRLYAVRGESEKAFAWLDRAYAQREPDFIFIKSDPSFAALRQDSRYKAFLKKVNLSE